MLSSKYLNTSSVFFSVTWLNPNFFDVSSANVTVSATLAFIKFSVNTFIGASSLSLLKSISSYLSSIPSISLSISLFLFLPALVLGVPMLSSSVSKSNTFSKSTALFTLVSTSAFLPSLIVLSCIILLISGLLDTWILLAKKSESSASIWSNTSCSFAFLPFIL